MKTHFENIAARHASFGVSRKRFLRRRLVDVDPVLRQTFDGLHPVYSCDSSRFLLPKTSQWN
jgi:hypothetical protein